MAMTTETTEFRRSTIVELGKSTMQALESLLPKQLYKPVFASVFWTYRTSLRLGYLRFLPLAILSGDLQARQRTLNVFSAMPFSLVGWSGLDVTYDLVRKVVREAVEGDLVECGVAQGGCAAVMAHALRDAGSPRHLWLFDSYEGLPDPTEQDFENGVTGTHVRPLPKGSCLGTIEQVSDLLFNRFGFDRSRIHLVQGWFQDTLPITRSKMSAIAILRIDGDWYESVKCCLEQLYDQVSSGGYVIIDDYWTCFGAKKAVDEFRAARGIATPITADGRGGCSFPKP